MEVIAGVLPIGHALSKGGRMRENCLGRVSHVQRATLGTAHDANRGAGAATPLSVTVAHGGGPLEHGSLRQAGGHARGGTCGSVRQQVQAWGDAGHRCEAARCVSSATLADTVTHSTHTHAVGKTTHYAPASAMLTCTFSSLIFLIRLERLRASRTCTPSQPDR